MVIPKAANKYSVNVFMILLVGEGERNVLLLIILAVNGIIARPSTVKLSLVNNRE